MAGEADLGAPAQPAMKVPPRRQGLDRVRSRAAVSVLNWNGRLIDRYAPHGPVWDPAEFPWTAELEAAFPEIRRELDELLATRELPTIEQVSGYNQGNVGIWRSYPLVHFGDWYEWNCARCPVTTDILRVVPGMTLAGFSVLEPGTHIHDDPHPNKGALRFQLGLRVPGPVEDCGLEIGGQRVGWEEGRGVVIDFGHPHHLWNDTPEPRAVFMIEFRAPLPWPLRMVNRVLQPAMTWFPETRGMRVRLWDLEQATAAA